MSDNQINTSNKVTQVDSTYHNRADRTIEALHIEDAKGNKEYGYLYNDQGVCFRYFPEIGGLISFVTDGVEPHAQFETEEQLDKYLKVKMITQGKRTWDEVVTNNKLIEEVNALAPNDI